MGGRDRWITTMGSGIKIEDGLKKTFKTVMQTWCVYFTNFEDGGEAG
jgi:hypothetical protein